MFYGFPLHPPNKPAVKRGDHLARVRIPMLFLQGTRDELADLALLHPIVEALGAFATLRVMEGADHSFHVLKKSGTTDAVVLRGLADTTATWADALLRKMKRSIYGNSVLKYAVRYQRITASQNDNAIRDARQQSDQPVSRRRAGI